MYDRQPAEHDPLPFAVPPWRLAEDGRLLSPSGAFVARLDLDTGAILMYDKRERRELAFTLIDWWALLQELLAKRKGDEESHESTSRNL